MKEKPSCSIPFTIRSIRCFMSPAKPLATKLAPASIIRDIGLNGVSMLPSGEEGPFHPS